MQTGIGFGACFDLWENRRDFWEQDHHTIGLQFHNVVRWLKVMHLDHYHLCFYSTIVQEGMQT
jgi:hypothetical protein